jgi:hypothetical protein
MNKPFPFARILKALFAGTGWIWGTREHNRAKKPSKKLAEYEPPHVVPCAQHDGMVEEGKREIGEC